MPRPNYAETLIGAAVVAVALIIAALAYYRTGMGGTATASRADGFLRQLGLHAPG